MKTGDAARSVRMSVIVVMVCLAVALGTLMPVANANAGGDRYQITNDCLSNVARQFYPKDNGIKIMCNTKTTRFDGSYYLTSNGSAHSFTDKQIKSCGSPCPR